LAAAAADNRELPCSFPLTAPVPRRRHPPLRRTSRRESHRCRPIAASPAYIVSPSCQDAIKIKPLWPREGRKAALARPATSWRRPVRADTDECIAVERDLWFLGDDPPPNAARPEPTEDNEELRNRCRCSHA
jgi:hypothetical protein